jgi:hypothetical protein
MFRVASVSAVFCVLTCSTALAKRAPPPAIKPIEKEGVRYVVPNDEGRRAYAQAWSVDDNKKLWEVELFQTAITPNLEEDVQWVFVKSMVYQNGKLQFVDEQGRTFLLDPDTRKVEEVKAGK